MHGGTQTICFWAFGGYNMSTGGVKAHVAACGSLAGWFQVAIQAVDWFEHLCIGSRCGFCELGPEGLGKLMMLSAKEEEEKTFEKIGIHLISKKKQLSGESKLKVQTKHI